MEWQLIYRFVGYLFDEADLHLNQQFARYARALEHEKETDGDIEEDAKEALAHVLLSFFRHLSEGAQAEIVGDIRRFGTSKTEKDLGAWHDMVQGGRA